MPISLRKNDKAKEIAFKILGRTTKEKKTSKKKKKEAILDVEETRRV